MSQQQDNGAALTAPHEPPYTFTANQGYGPSEATPSSFANTNRQNGQLALDADDDDDLDDIFADEDDETEEWDPTATDLTKNYNRQRQLQDGSSPAVPRNNAQKPKANTFASVDDQISALSKHAAKIRLDDVKQGQDKDKDKADRATSELVLDQRTRMILLQMINNNVVSEIHGAISTGKEANVYGAVAYTDAGAAVQRAVKIYKTAILVFKDRERYMTGEHRFKSGPEKGNNRKMVKMWAEKEFRNLHRLRSAGIPCPEPIKLKLHVMVMSFLGDRKGWAYPRLRDANIVGADVEQQWRSLFIQLVATMRRIYQVCKLVHADLSEYNILYHDGTLYIIDVSQSVEHDHPRSLEFLRMDIKNVGDYFRRQGVDTLADRTIFDFITAPEGTIEMAEMTEAIEQLYISRPQAATTEEGLAELEVDNEVFRNQYIPQTLDQVYDIEKDVQRVKEGEGQDLVYRNLLADQVVLPKKEGTEEQDGASSDDESGSGAALDSDEDSDDSGDESRFEKGRPRGRKHEDKDEKKQHKQAVKEAKREKRKDKIPKHLKKKLVTSTSRKKK